MAGNGTNGSRVREWSGWLAALVAFVGLVVVLANDRQDFAVELQDHESRIKAVERAVEVVAEKLEDVPAHLAAITVELRYLREEMAGP